MPPGGMLYTEALAGKNRELAEIRDALNLRNQELQQRNVELADLNLRLSEQSRLYQSLRVNLDQLLALFQAGQDIASSLVIDQVRRAIVQATARLFDVAACRLVLWMTAAARRASLWKARCRSGYRRVAQMR
jgi:hypothetical protein